MECPECEKVVELMQEMEEEINALKAMKEEDRTGQFDEGSRFSYMQILEDLQEIYQ